MKTIAIALAAFVVLAATTTSSNPWGFKESISSYFLNTPLPVYAKSIADEDKGGSVGMIVWDESMKDSDVKIQEISAIYSEVFCLSGAGPDYLYC